uniref:Uncharacterized protein n=1 Tax=Anguilla anguilla TaxID=7936 RepID=A0A0E9WNQ2_ANGAN
MDAMNSACPSEKETDYVQIHAATFPGAVRNNKNDQEKLSTVVKSVHRKLRRKYREGRRFCGVEGTGFCCAKIACSVS